MEWDYTGRRKGRDLQKKKIGKAKLANQKRKKKKSKNSKR